MYIFHFFSVSFFQLFLQDGFKPLAATMAKVLTELRQCKEVKWTYISPAG